MEWLFLILAIILVFISELFNTALEKLADKVESGFNPEIGAIKDYESATVKIASIFAVVVGGNIFGPKVLS